MGSNPGVLTSLMPGANYSGSSVAVPSSPITPGGGNPALGGSGNPFLPALPSGQGAMPMTTTAGAMPANTGAGVGSPTGIPGGLGGNVAAGTPGGTALWRALMGQGIPAGVAGLIQQFLGGGAGYNPQVAADLIAQMQPSIERGQENLVEQFSAMGNRFGSPAAVGLADYGSQVNLNIGELLSNLYEQSVQNYMGVLMGVNRPKQQSGGIMGILSQIAGIGGSAIEGASGGGGVTDILSSILGGLAA